MRIFINFNNNVIIEYKQNRETSNFGLPVYPIINSSKAHNRLFMLDSYIFTKGE